MSYGGALDPDSRYIYDQQYLYRVDPTTMVVRQILRLLLAWSVGFHHVGPLEPCIVDASRLAGA